MATRLELVGRKFGNLEVKSFAGMDHSAGGSQWDCLCKCGKMVVLAGSSLMEGNNKSCGCEQRIPKLSLEQAEKNRCWTAYKQNARARGRMLDLTKAEFEALICAPCTYCGREAAPCHYNGIDRVESSGDYTKGNTASCCWFCNRAKGAMSVEEFRVAVQALYHHLFQIKTAKAGA